MKEMIEMDQSTKLRGGTKIKKQGASGVVHVLYFNSYNNS